MRRAERFFFMLCEVEERKSSARFQDASSFLEGESWVGRMVQHLAHEHEVGVIVGEACLRHVGDFGRHVFNVLLLQNLLEPADDFRVVIQCGHVLAAAREHK